MSKSLFNKVTGLKVFPCEYCEIFKNTYFEEHLRTAASSSKACKSQLQIKVCLQFLCQCVTRMWDVIIIYYLMFSKLLFFFRFISFLKSILRIQFDYYFNLNYICNLGQFYLAVLFYLFDQSKLKN